jgi:hypothetical protein
MENENINNDSEMREYQNIEESSVQSYRINNNNENDMIKNINNISSKKNSTKNEKVVSSNRKSISRYNEKENVKDDNNNDLINNYEVNTMKYPIRKNINNNKNNYNSNDPKTPESLPILMPKTNEYVSNTILPQNILSCNKHIDLLPSNSVFLPVSERKNSGEDENELLKYTYEDKDNTNINPTLEFTSPIDFTETELINNDNSMYYNGNVDNQNDENNIHLNYLQRKMSDQKKDKIRIEHEIINMDAKDKNYMNSPSNKRNSLKLQELDSKQRQYLLNDNNKIDEAMNTDITNVNNLNKYFKFSENTYKTKKSNNILSPTISKQELQQQIAESLIGINSDEEKIARLTKDLVQARNIINQLRDSLAFSDDERAQLQKEFDCFQDQVEIERINWKNEFKNIKEIQTKDYKENIQLKNYIIEMEENLKNNKQEESQNKRVYQETLYQLKESQNKYNQLETDFNLLSKKYKELEHYYIDLKRSNEEILHENHMLKETDEELMQINDDLKKENKHLIQLNKVLEEETKKIDESKEQYYKEESENMVNQMQDIIQKNNEYINEINRMKSVQDVFENEYNELKQLLSEERSKNDQCESELSLFGRRIRNLMEQNNKLSSENNRIRTELRNLQFNPPIGKLNTQIKAPIPNKDNTMGSYNDLMMNDYSKIRKNLAPFSSFSVPKNLRTSSSTTDLKNIKWSTTSSVGNDLYQSSIHSSLRNINERSYINSNNKDKMFEEYSNSNYGLESASNSTPEFSSYSNSPKRYSRDKSSYDNQTKIPANSSNIVTGTSYLDTLTKMSPDELETLLRSLTLRKDQLQAEYVKVPSTNRKRKELLEEKLDEVEKQMGGCRMRLKALKVM